MCGVLGGKRLKKGEKLKHPGQCYKKFSKKLLLFEIYY